MHDVYDDKAFKVFIYYTVLHQALLFMNVWTRSNTSSSVPTPSIYIRKEITNDNKWKK